MYCAQCGSQVPDDSAFCHRCGARVVTAEKSTGGTGAQAGAPTAQQAAASAPPYAARPQAGVVAAPPVATRQVVVGIVVIVGVVLAIVGCLLTWADLEIIKGNGFDVGYLTDPDNGEGQDGLFVLMIGLAAGGLAVRYFFGRNALASLAIVALGIAATAIAGYNLGKLMQGMQELCDEMEISDCNRMEIVGEGIYVTIVGGIITAAAALVGLFRGIGQGSAPVLRQEMAARPTLLEPPEAPARAVPQTRVAAETPAIRFAPLAGTTLESLENSLRGFLSLNASVIQDVRTNATLTVPSVLIAAAAILATSFGGFISYATRYTDRGSPIPEGEFFLKTVVVGTLLGTALWLVGAGVTLYVIRAALKQDVRLEEVLRVAGFAATPLTIGFFVFIPGIGFGIGLISAALLLTFTVLAIHKAFDMPVERALLAGVSGFAVWSLVLPLVATADSPFGPGIFVFDWAQDFLAR